MADELKTFLTVLQTEVVDPILADIDDITSAVDIETMREEFVDLRLIGLGNPFEFDLSLPKKRALLRALPVMYKFRGTARGLIDTIRFFLDIEVTIGQPAPGWKLGFDKIENTTKKMAPAGQQGALAFTIISPQVLTQTERDQMKAIALFVKPAHTIFAGIEEP